MKYKKDTSAHKTIKEWSEDDRPREKLAKFGASVLSDAELLAIIINTGTARQSAVDLARTLIHQYSDLPELAKKNHKELSKIRGIGETKALKLLAAFEIGRRIQSKAAAQKTKITGPDEMAELYLPLTRDWKTEKFMLVLLDSANQIIRDIVLTEGILNASLVHPREVFKTAIDERAASIILIHNHPSGNPAPSSDDMKITEQLKQAGQIMGIPVKDHLILAGHQFTSMAKEGLL